MHFLKGLNYLFMALLTVTASVHSYSSVVHYDPNWDGMGNDTAGIYQIAESELRSKLRQLIPQEHKIVEITVYKNPMFHWQRSKWLLYHAYVVLQTNNLEDGQEWWWSVEKTAERVTIQRSSQLEAVRDYYERSRRAEGVTQVSRDRGRGTIRDLIDHLHFSHLVGNGYNLLWNNCKHFAANLFNKFAADLWCRVGAFDCLNH